MNIYRYRALIFTIFTGVLLFIFHSCEYEPKGEYIVNLEKPGVPPSINFDLNLMTDTISFYWASKVRLTINAGNIKISSVSFLLDGQPISVMHDNSKYFTILDFSQVGVHKFRIEVLTGSGSHSIAEGLGVEGFQYDSHEWTLVANAIPAGNLTYILDYSGITFNWKKYDGTDLKEYKIREVETGRIFDKIHSTSYNYSEYVGQTGYYELYVVDTEGNEHSWGGCFLNRSLPVLRIAQINRQVALTWNNTIFRNNVAEYQLFQRDQVSSMTKIGTFSVDDTVYIFPDIASITGKYMSFYLYTVPKSNYAIQNIDPFTSMLQNINPILPGPKFSNHYGAVCSGFYYEGYSADFQKRLLLKYSADSDRVDVIKEFEPDGSNDLSPNGISFLCAHDSILDLFDVNTKTIKTSVNIKSAVPYFHWSVGPKVSDNGICTFVLNDSLFVFDIPNDKLVATRSIIPNQFKISPGGQYISELSGDSLFIYQVSENSVNIISRARMTNSYSYLDYGFIPNNPDYLFTFEPPLLNVRTIRDLSLVRSLDLGTFLYNIDYCNNKVLTYGGGDYLNVYDFATGDLLHRVTFGVAGGSGSQYYTLLTDNTIYFSGYKYYLPGKK